MHELVKYLRPGDVVNKWDLLKSLIDMDLIDEVCMVAEWPGVVTSINI